MSEEEEERVAIDCFPPSLLRYDDLLTYVVEEVVEVSSVVEAGEVKGGGDSVFEKGCVSASPFVMSGGPSGVVFSRCLRVARRLFQ